jgi:hypothetical protein
VTTNDEPVRRVMEVKEKFDDVLDNLNFIVNGVISRDNMMLKCKPYMLIETQANPIYRSIQSKA